jgi:hypothetical protein
MWPVEDKEYEAKKTSRAGKRLGPSNTEFAEFTETRGAVRVLGVEFFKPVSAEPLFGSTGQTRRSKMGERLNNITQRRQGPRLAALMSFGGSRAFGRSHPREGENPLRKPLQMRNGRNRFLPRLRDGNDRYFVSDPIPNDTTTNRLEPVDKVVLAR